ACATSTPTPPRPLRQESRDEAEEGLHSSARDAGPATEDDSRPHRAGGLPAHRARPGTAHAGLGAPRPDHRPAHHAVLPQPRTRPATPQPTPPPAHPAAVPALDARRLQTLALGARSRRS